MTHPSDGAQAPDPAGPTSTADHDELAALQALDGVDVTVGLAAVGGRLPIYRRLLARFVRTHEFDEARWQVMLDEGRSQEARQRVHAIRGAASTLGLIAIDEAARVLEAALVGGADAVRLRELSTTLGRDLAQGVEALRGLPGVRRAMDDLPPHGG